MPNVKVDDFLIFYCVDLTLVGIYGDAWRRERLEV
jgi:hypothetical protein